MERLEMIQVEQVERVGKAAPEDWNLSAVIPDSGHMIADALMAQRAFTLSLYRDLPEAYWVASQFPFRAELNPPLWELAHIAYFAEYFCLRWQPDDPLCRATPSSLDVADSLFNSNTVPHADRWTNAYPSRSVCEDYMRDVLQRVVAEAAKDDASRHHLFQLALLHEDMHAEALVMTLNTLGLPLPSAIHDRLKRQYPRASSGHAPGQIALNGGEIRLGQIAVGTRAFQFDNELPPKHEMVAPFEIDAFPVSARAFAAWHSGVHGSAEAQDDGTVAMHISHAEASAYANAHGRRLPTEAEWEFAATHSPQFSESTGEVWEWTNSVFTPYPGFVAGPYAEYSAPWFPNSGTTHYVLKGGSFATHPRLQYPQYRNFYAPHRRDMFCGFRTCRSVD
jgi:gamma-glutamyl hercynylcysteine S-oxide synthase